MKYVLTFLLLLTTPPAGASTFVGNGGNAGDVELEVTNRQLRTIFADIAERDGQRRALCECAEDELDHPMCDVLKKLTAPQVRFCAERLRERAGELREWVDRARIQWTHESIEVREGKRDRAADAVADRDARAITVNLDRYMQLKSYERLFLMAHEFFHFTSIDGHPLTDEGAVGPFAGEEGARGLVNAMAAAVVMESVEAGLITKYQTSLKRPHGWKHFWLSADGGISRNEKDQTDIFANKEYAKFGASFRYHFANGFGLILSYRSLRASKSILTQTKIEEFGQAIGAGVAYRFFPFRDPLTFFGQSHLVLQALVESISGKYSYKDDFNPSVDDSASAIGESFGCSYYIPALWNLWVYLGGSYEIQSYQFSKALVKYDTNKLTSSLGVSYAF